MNEQQFYAINNEIDNLFEEDDDESENKNDNNNSNNNNEQTFSEIEDIWDSSQETNNIFDTNFESYLKSFFTSSNKNNLLDFQTFIDWKDIKELLEAGNMDASILEDLWLEALEYQYKNKQINEDEIVEINLHKFLQKDLVNKEIFMIEYDTFLRLNYRIEQVIIDIESKLQNLDLKKIESFYKSEFKKLCYKKEKLLSFKQLLNWSETKELINLNQISIEKLEFLFNALPKNNIKSASFYNKSGLNHVFGIDENSFLALNRAIDLSIEEEK
jgi:hypothetical protein